MFVLGVIPGLPFVPFALLGSLMAFAGYTIPRASRGRRRWTVRRLLRPNKRR